MLILNAKFRKHYHLYVVYNLWTTFMYIYYFYLPFTANTVDNLGKGKNKIRMYSSDAKNIFLKVCESEWMMYLFQFKV